VFEHLVTTAISALEWAVGKRALVETGTFFSDLKSSVDGQFAAAISHFSGQSLTQISTLPASAPDRTAPASRSPPGSTPAATLRTTG
jgi:hypothetical protein